MKKSWFFPERERERAVKKQEIKRLRKNKSDDWESIKPQET